MEFSKKSREKQFFEKGNGGIKQVVSLPKEKSQFILFERTRLKKQKKTGKGARQQRRWNKNSFTKKGWTNEKGGLFFFEERRKINKSEFSKKKESTEEAQERESK